MAEMGRRPFKLMIDLVPETCWYSSLYKRMPRSKWDEIRHQAYLDAGQVCQICGAKKKLECHEVWEYDDEKLLQKLKGFMALCPMCHHVKHFGRSQQLAAEGRLDLDAIIAHFCKINKVTRKEFSAHKSEGFSIWQERSQKKWKTDLGRWSIYVRS